MKNWASKIINAFKLFKIVLSKVEYFYLFPIILLLIGFIVLVAHILSELFIPAQRCL